MARIDPVTFVDPRGREITVRNCNLGDGEGSIPFMRAIARETTYTNNTPDRTFSPIDEIERGWVEALDDPHRLHIGAFCDGVMVGQLACHRIGAGHAYVGHIARFGMMLLQDFWGSGTARRLIEGMEHYAAAEKIVRIEAMVRADNHRGRRFYASAGFVEEGVRRHAAMIDGVLLDDVYIGKIYV